MMSERETGYRDAIASPPEPPPTIELLTPTAAEEAELDRIVGREHTRSYGMAIGAAVLFKWVAPFLVESPYLRGVVILGAVALFLYAIVTRVEPRGVGPAFVRLTPGREVSAGQRLGVAMVLRPRAELKLDPLLARLVATVSEGGRERVVYESEHAIAARQAVEAGQSVRLETTFLLAEDAPPSSTSPRTRWRLEVTIGTPPVLRRSLAVRVGAATRRRRSGGRRA